MKRRSFVKWAAAFPLLAQVGLQEALGTGWAEVARNSTDNIYTRLGVKPLINGRGTWTYLSASLELPEVRAAQVEASQHFVNIFDLQHAVGRRLAELTGAESGMITSGAAGAMAVATAGCIAGTDPDKIWQLPNTDGLKNEVVMVGGRSVFDSAIRLAGGKLVLAESAEQIANAITPNTVMIYTSSSPEQLAKEIAVAKAHHVPIFMDAADGIPPVDKLQLFAKMGCDLYTFSGGKGLCGPQSSGILLGRKDLIEAALANSNPWEGAVCRPMKVGKEEIMGCLAAVETWLKMDVPKLNKEWGVACATHRDPGRNRSWCGDKGLHPGRKPMPDPQHFLGSESLALHHRRLRKTIARGHSGHRRPDRRQSKRRAIPKARRCQNPEKRR